MGVLDPQALAPSPSAPPDERTSHSTSSPLPPSPAVASQGGPQAIACLPATTASDGTRVAVCRVRPSKRVFIPPPQFGLVEEGLVRSGQPSELNFPFLDKLGLKTVVWLAPEDPNEPLCAHSPLSLLVLARLSHPRGRGQTASAFSKSTALRCITSAPTTMRRRMTHCRRRRSSRRSGSSSTRTMHPRSSAATRGGTARARSAACCASCRSGTSSPSLRSTGGELLVPLRTAASGSSPDRGTRLQIRWAESAPAQRAGERLPSHPGSGVLRFDSGLELSSPRCLTICRARAVHRAVRRAALRCPTTCA